MWGPVRPLDRIKAYRLEMACKKLPPPRARLAEYWRDLSTDALLAGFDGDDKLLVNIASDEYANAIDFDRARAAGVKVLKVDFHQGGKKAPTVHLKYGRGLVARYVMQHDVDDVAGLKKFDLEGYAFASMDESTIVFARAAAPPKKPASKKRKAA